MAYMSDLQKGEQRHHGDADNGVRVSHVVGAQDRRRHSLPAVQQAEQDAQARLHRLQAARSDDGQVRYAAPSSLLSTSFTLSAAYWWFVLDDENFIGNILA